jgi:hypothetical protein
MARIAGMNGRGLAVTLALAMLAGCSGEKRAASAPPPVAPVVTPGLSVAPTPLRPEGADAVDAALSDVQLFNATATESLASITKDEARIRALAARAIDLSRRVEAAPAEQRPGLAKNLEAALAEREAAHTALGQSLENFRTTSTETSGLVEGAAVLCGPVPPPATPGAPPPPPPTPGTLAAYPPCATLAAEQASLAANIAALSKAFESAEAAYRQDRRRIDEAAATMALVR